MKLVALVSKLTIFGGVNCQVDGTVSDLDGTAADETELGRTERRYQQLITQMNLGCAHNVEQSKQPIFQFMKQNRGILRYQKGSKNPQHTLRAFSCLYQTFQKRYCKSL